MQTWIYVESLTNIICSLLDYAFWKNIVGEQMYGTMYLESIQ